MKKIMLLVLTFLSSFSMATEMEGPQQTADVESQQRKTYSDVYVSTMPKAGTNLLFKALNLLEIDFKRKYDAKNNRLGSHLASMISVKNLKNIERAFDSKNKYIVLVRDPRDACISFINWVMREKDRKVDSDWKALPMRTKIHSLITESNSPEQKALQSKFFLANFRIAQRLAEKKLENVLILHFEDLVGEMGGGTYEKQFQAVKSIVDFLDLKISDGKVSYACSKLWGGTGTFTKKRKKIGQWKDFFKPNHIRIFKRKYNDCLISLGYEKNRDWE